jgi:membrane-associated phospholipid phosphatase
MLLRKRLNETSGRWLMPLGMLAVAMEIILGRISGTHHGISDFAEGFLLGLGIVMLMASIVLNARGCARIRAKRSE